MRARPHWQRTVARRCLSNRLSPDLEMLNHHPHSQPIRVLLVDDHPAVRLGLRKLIDDQPDMRIVVEAATAREAIGRGDRRCDVAIVDYHLGGAEDGLWLTTELKRIEPPPRVLVYSAFADGALAVNALIAGADGLLGKHELGEEICSAIRRLAHGRHNLPAVTSSIADTMRSRLQPRRPRAVRSAASRAGPRGDRGRAAAHARRARRPPHRHAPLAEPGALRPSRTPRPTSTAGLRTSPAPFQPPSRLNGRNQCHKGALIGCPNL